LLLCTRAVYAHAMAATPCTATSITPLSSSTDNEAAVYIEGATPAFVAAVQSTLLNDVPCLGIHTLWLDDAPKYVHGDVLALRAAQCGWTVVPHHSTEPAATDDSHPSTAFANPVAHGSFDFVSGPITGHELCAKHIAWNSPSIAPTHPNIVLAALPPGARIAGEVVLAWGTARHGPAWRAVPRVTWQSYAWLTWLKEPCTLNAAQLECLQDVLLGDAADTVEDAVVGVPQSVVANAGLQELADMPEWQDTLQYSTLSPDDCTAHIMSVHTNGQMPALLAVTTALRIMALDARSIVNGCM